MDTRDTRLQNLLFLLSAAPLGLGCGNSSDDTTSDTGAATENATTENPTTENPTTENPTSGTPTSTTASPTTGDTAEDTTAGPGSTDDLGETTEAPSDTTGGAETSTGGQVIPEACSMYADLITLCYGPEFGDGIAEACAAALEMYETMFGAECATAVEDYYSCLSALTCEEFLGATLKEPACPEQAMALETACPEM